VKTAFITHSFPEASETFIARQAKLLDADVVAESPNYSLPEDYHGQFRLFFLSSDGPWQILKGRLEAHLPERASRLYPKSLFRRFGIRPIVPAATPLSWQAEAEGAWQRYLDKHRPDVVLAHWAPNALAAMPACRERNIPMVIHFHGYDASTMMRSAAYRQALRELFAHVHGAVCASSYVLGVVRDAGCPPEKLHLIPYGVPTDDFHPTECVLRQPCRFIAVSRLAAGKGVLVTLEAFRLARQTRPFLHLTIVGGGPLRNAVNHFVATHRLERSVSLLGPVHNQVVQRLLAESSVFVQASMTDETGWVEGWGVSLAEGLASGLPAVVTHSGGMIDLVKDAYNGFLFDEGDAAGMAERMLRLADDPALRLAMGRRGRQLIEDLGNVECNVRRLEMLLKSACRPALAAG